MQALVIAPGRPAQGTCARLLCASQWLTDGSAIQSMLSDRGEWVQRTQASGVRTALLYASSWLVQWHEGPAEAVEAEWMRVRSHPLFRAARLLHRSTGPATLAEPVQLASLHAAEGAGDVARRLRAIERENGQGSTADPAGVWQALCAPSRLLPAGTLVPDRCDVLALASEDNEAVELLRQLALEKDLPMAYQRYAGSELHRGDVGAAFLDLAVDGAPATRLHAMPRRALAGGLAMLGLRDVGTLLLLLGSEKERAGALLAQVERLLPALQRPPAVLVASRCPYARDAALRRLVVAAGPRGSVMDVGTGTPATSPVVAELLLLRARGLAPRSRC